MNYKRKEVWNEFFRLKKEELKNFLFKGPRCFAGFLLICAVAIGIVAAGYGLILLLGYIHVEVIGVVFAFVEAKSLFDLYTGVGALDLVIVGIFSLIFGSLIGWLRQNWQQAVHNVDQRHTETQSKQLDRILNEVVKIVKAEPKKKVGKKGKKTYKKAK